MTDSQINAEVENIVNEISSTWVKQDKSGAKKLILLIGGFQGSGKSSILDYIKNKVEILTISNDEVRQILFYRCFPFSDDFLKIVESVSVLLIRKAVGLGYSIAIDENITPPKIEKIKQALKQAGYSDYKFLTVFLQVPKEELIRRVLSRTKVANRYQGTVDELEASLKKHGTINLSAYDLVIDSNEMSVEEIGKKIIKEINSTR